jgi:hypothetical protein
LGWFAGEALTGSQIRSGSRALTRTLGIHVPCKEEETSKNHDKETHPLFENHHILPFSATRGPFNFRGKSAMHVPKAFCFDLIENISFLFFSGRREKEESFTKRDH